MIHRKGSEVGFAPDNWVDAGGLFFVFGLGLSLLVELNGTEEVAMVGHRDGGHSEFGNAVHQFTNSNGAIQERVFRVKMEMDERVGHAFFYASGRWVRSKDRVGVFRRKGVEEVGNIFLQVRPLFVRVG